MSETVVGSETVEEPVADEQLVATLDDQARPEGMQLIKRVLEGEISDHLGYDKPDSEGRNSRNGSGPRPC